MKKVMILVFALTFAAASLGSAQTTIWTTDKAHSQVSFSVAHLVISQVGGRFKDFDATLKIDKDDLTTAQVEAIIKTNTIDTDNEVRDKHLRTDDFLNVEKYPEIKFKSTSVEKTGKDTYKIKGDLTIRDVTKPVVLDTKYSGTIVDPWGNTKAGFKATTTVDRTEYGVKWNKAIEAGSLVAGNMVEITLQFEFQKKK